MDCPNCGAYNASSSVRCRRCGHVLRPDADEPDVSGFDEGLETETGGSGWEAAGESGSEWDSGRRESPEPEPNPWSFTEPEAAERQDEPASGQSSTAWGAGIPSGPDVGPGIGPPPDIPNYLWQSIAVTFCCCLPLGIPAIVFASRVNAFVASGNYTAAEEASQKARNWSLAAFIAGLLVLIGYFCLVAVGGSFEYGDV